MPGISYGQTKLAIDQYNEDQKKKDYIQSVLDEYRNYMDHANDNADDAAEAAAVIAAIFGDSSDDVAFAYNLAHDIGYEYYLHDVNFDDWVEGIDDPDFQVKFDKQDWQRDLYNNYENVIEDNYDQHLQNSAWNIVNNVYSYGQSGGFEDWGGEKPEGYYTGKNIWDRMKNTTKEMFGIDTKIDIPKGFSSEAEWLESALNRVNNGESLDDIFTTQQKYQLGLIGNNQSEMLRLLQSGSTSSSPPAPGGDN